jgi:hypothetical protein
MDDAVEIWMPIPSAPGFEASSFGRIRAVMKRGPSPAGFIFKRQIKLYSGIPYEYLRLPINGKRKEVRVHRLICDAFHGAPPIDKPHAAHGNGNSLDNLPGNLRWTNPQGNIDDREKHGRTARGSANGFSKLKESDIPCIRALLSQDFVQMDIGKQFNVSNHAISDIARGKRWKHII